MYNLMIRTKLQMPIKRERAISRPALIQKLDEGLAVNRRLTLISAPPGYGKTSLAVEWANHSDANFVWLSIDSGDDEPIRFFTYLIAALQTQDKNIGMAAQSLLDAPKFPPLEMLMGTLINDISETVGKIVLVLDDFQYIQNSILNEAIQLLMENQPQTLHLVVVSRKNPAISLPRFRARGQMTEIRENDLKFSHEEA